MSWAGGRCSSPPFSSPRSGPRSGSCSYCRRSTRPPGSSTSSRGPPSSQAAAGAFSRRTQELETAIAKDEAELATLEASPGGEASHLLRVAKLREEISGKRSSLAAQRSDFESFQLALAARSSALSLVT